MKKSKFIRSTLILIIGGALTKILGLIIKIITTRYLGDEGIGKYMLIMPTFMALISICQLGFPIAISKLVSEERQRGKNILISVIPISIFINTILFILVLFSAKFISYNMLHEPDTYLGVLSIAFVLPFISISSIIRGYFFGKERMFPHVFSNVLEDIIRLIFLFITLPIFIEIGIEFAIAIAILSNILSEISSIIILYLFLPKNVHITKEDFKIDKTGIKEVLNIGIPTTGNRLIGNLGYFLEPIILTSILLHIGYSNNFIVSEYGIISGYVLPLLLIPSFFTMAISQALIPIVSKNYVNNNKKYARTKMYQAIFISLFIGIIFTIIVELFPEFLLNTIYGTKKGVLYLKILAPFCLLQYIQSPLSASLQAIGKAKESMYSTLIGTIARCAALFIFSYLRIGLWGLIISIIISMILVTFYNLFKLNHFFK